LNDYLNAKINRESQKLHIPTSNRINYRSILRTSKHFLSQEHPNIHRINLDFYKNEAKTYSQSIFLLIGCSKIGTIELNAFSSFK